MPHPEFPPKAAHLTYVTPLVAVLGYLQMQRGEPVTPWAGFVAAGLGLVLLVTGFGVALFARRLARKPENSALRVPATIGFWVNLVAWFGVVWVFAEYAIGSRS